MDLSASTPRLRREQVAGMNIHYIMWSLDYFLDAQQRLGFKTIELWAAEPHVTLDHVAVRCQKAPPRAAEPRLL